MNNYSFAVEPITHTVPSRGSIVESGVDGLSIIDHLETLM